MIQKIEEQNGHLFFHFGAPPENVGEIDVVNCVVYQRNQILFCKWRDNDIWVIPGGRVDPGETTIETFFADFLDIREDCVYN